MLSSPNYKFTVYEIVESGIAMVESEMDGQESHTPCSLLSSPPLNSHPESSRTPVSSMETTQLSNRILSFDLGTACEQWASEMKPKINAFLFFS